MHSLKDIQLKCNKQFVVNFDGGELSSDGGLLMLKEFLCTLGIEKILRNNFKTNDPASFRIHTDDQNLLQMIYQIFGTYYEDNCADELRRDPVLSAVLGKEALASQPTISRFFNRMDDSTLRQFDDIMCQLRKKIISQELKDNGYNAEKIESALRSKLTEKAGYTDANYVTYDLSLQISLDGGKTWVNVTEENFPAKGVTVLLAYPEGTGKDTHDFIVTHMLSRPYGIYPAGHIEELPVTETSEGIQVTLYSLSPIGIAWKLEEVGDNTEPGNQKPDGSGTQTSTDTSTAAGALAADTQNLPKSPLTGDDYEANTFLEMAGRIAKCASVLMLVVGVVGELVLYRRKRSRSDDRNLQ